MVISALGEALTPRQGEPTSWETGSGGDASRGVGRGRLSIMGQDSEPDASDSLGVDFPSQAHSDALLREALRCSTTGEFQGGLNFEPPSHSVLPRLQSIRSGEAAPLTRRQSVADRYSKALR